MPFFVLGSSFPKFVSCLIFNHMKQLILFFALLCAFHYSSANNYLMEVPLDNYTKEQPNDPDKPNNDRDLNLLVTAFIDFNQIELNSNLSISNVHLWIENSNNNIIYNTYSSQQSFSHVFNNVNLSENEEYTIFVLIGSSCYSGNFSL